MDQYRVFGNPIKQSRSPAIHHAFAQQTKQILHYQTELVALDAFEQAIKNFIACEGKGANITVPFKEQAFSICDELSESASMAGAVNTLTFRNNKIYGDNTDGLGLVQDLLRQGITLNNSRILLLGAGGAAKGVVLPLLDQQPACIVIANRTISKAEQLCQQFNNSKLSSCGYSEVATQHFDIIINATSASLSGAIPAIAADVVKGSVCYDMVYGKELTPFLIWAKQQEARQIIDGLGMLVGQAAESFALWRGCRPEVDIVIAELREQLMMEQV